MKVPNRLDLLDLDIDVRLTELWQEAYLLYEDDGLPLLGQFMRCAYAKGYKDCMEAEDPALFYRQHGYRPPARKAA